MSAVLFFMFNKAMLILCVVSALVLFRFYLTFDVKEIFKTKCLIEPHLWTWTYPAPYGAYQFLKIIPAEPF
jgi:FtsH-binding integral membrane protein